MSDSSVGRARRLARLVREGGPPSVLVPLDDGPISGPEHHLRDVQGLIGQLKVHHVDATLGFEGLFRHSMGQLGSLGQVLNLSASTTLGVHTRKVPSSTVESALTLGVDGVACHVNVGSQFEPEMLSELGRVSASCHRWGMPLLALMYPRGERGNQEYGFEDIKRTSPESYAAVVRHCARLGVELGADLVQVPFTGSVESFRTVVECCYGIPIIASTGKMLPARDWLTVVQQAIQAGARAVSSGRNVFQRADPASALKALDAVVHAGMSVDEALALHRPN